MIFICEKQKLLDAILITQKAITGKSTMPLLEGIYLNAEKEGLNHEEAVMTAFKKCTA